MTWQKIYVSISTATLCYYSELPVEIGDKVVVETRYGPVIGEVTTVIETIHENPFNKSSKYSAKKHVLENATKKVYKEEPIMFGCKTVEVKHISSNRKNVFYTDLNLKVGDHVVYESDHENGKSMHVGIVTDVDPDVVTAKNFIVDAIDLTAYNDRMERMKKASKIRLQLEAKKKQYEDMEILRLIAQHDEDAKQMLAEYSALMGVKQEV